MKILSRVEFNEFLKAAFTPTKNPSRLGMWCEECDDNIIVTVGKGTSCGHTPQKLKDIQEWTKKHSFRRIVKGRLLPVEYG